MNMTKQLCIRVVSWLAALCVALAPLVPFDRVQAEPQIAQMVKDINDIPQPSNPYGFAELDGVVYFAAMDSDHGTELWRSDGTAGGTWMVEDLYPGSESGMLTGTYNFQGAIYFLAPIPQNGMWGGMGLWKIEEADGEKSLVKQIASPGGNSGHFLECAGKLYVRFGYPPSYWGTPLIHLNIGGTGTTSLGNSIQSTACFLDRLFFVGGNNSFGLMRTNGAAVQRVGSVNLTYESRLAVLGSNLYFLANDGVTGNELWKTDGTNVSQVKDILTGAEGSDPRSLVAWNGALYFRAVDGANGSELWTSDGTDAGTVLLKDIEPGSGSSGPQYLTPAGTSLYFSAYTSETSTDLWRTDGTTSGTVRVFDLRPGAIRSDVYEIYRVENHLFFDANGPDGYGLWHFDLTNGEYAALDVDPSADISPVSSENFTAGNGKVFFSAYQSETDYDRELWITDGTVGGTRELKDLNPHTPGSGIRNLVVIGDDLYFAADDGRSGQELWRSDGTEAGTQMVVNLSESRKGFPYPSPNNPIVMNGNLYFVGCESWQPDYGFEICFLYKQDGTSGEITPLKQVQSYIEIRTNGSEVYFNYFEGSDRELWKTDGTVGGTNKVGNLTGSIYADFVQLNGLSYFLSYFFESGLNIQLNATNGSSVQVIHEFQHCEISQFYVDRGLEPVGSQLYFPACNAEKKPTLWQTDGTAGGLVEVVTPAPVNLKAIFTGLYEIENWLYITLSYHDPNLGREVGGELLRTQGAGTGVQSLGVFDRAPFSLAEFNGEVFFLARKDSENITLWKTNGTQEGTVPAIPPTTESISGQGAFVILGNDLYFSATSTEHGTELWRSDGTETGTERLSDINPGPADGVEPLLVEKDGKIFFLADDGFHGSELWVYDPSLLINQPPTSILLNPSAFSENTSNALVGSLIVADPNPGDTFTCTLNAPTQGFRLEGLQLYSDVARDYETDPHSYTLSVTCQDTGGLSLIQNVTIQLTDVDETPPNQAPTGLSLSPSAFPENQANALVGALAVTDPNPCDTFTCALNAPAQGFSLTGMQLHSIPARDYEVDLHSYTLSLTCQDAGGLSVTREVAVQLTDVDEPPSADPIPDQTFTSWNGPQTLRLTGLSVGAGEGGALTVSAVSDHPEILPDPVVILDPPGADPSQPRGATLQFTPLPGAHGEMTITVTVGDGNNQVTYTFKVAITEQVKFFLPLMVR